MASANQTPSQEEERNEEDIPVEGEVQEEQRIPQTISITDIELEKLQEEVKEYKNKYLHLLAESENARKRMQKERHELIQFSLQNLIIDFLTPIDQMENALNCTSHMSDEVKNWAAGFQMITTQFKDVLSSNGVSAFTSLEEQFDPHLHEAIEMVETEEHPPGVIVEETMKGYKMRDRVIRPARVKVSKQKDEPESKEDTNE